MSTSSAALVAPRPSREAGLRQRARRALRQIGWARLLGTLAVLLAAVLFARTSWELPLAQDAERTLYDLRALVTAPKVDQDGRIVMVVYTDQTLEATGKRSPLDRALLAQALRRLDTLGAKAIGIDILIDQKQPEDDELVAAFRSMRTPTYLAYASNATNAGFVQTWQEAFMNAFHARLAPGNVHKASIRIEADPDAVMRSWPVQPRDLPPLLANAMAPVNEAFRSYHGGIVYQLPKFQDRAVFSELPVDLFASDAGAEALKSQIAGRYVLIGGDISDLDQFETPATRLTGGSTIPGLEVHATLLAQLLDGRLLADTPGWILWLAALLVVAAAGLTSLIDLRAWKLALILAGQVLFFVGLPIALQAIGTDTQRIPAFGWVVAYVIAYAAVGTAARAVGSEQRRFAQSALGKYLPRDIANEILAEPERLALHGEKCSIFALFTDLEGFTKLSHAIPPETVAYLLNRYLDRLSEVVLAHGGTIDKFVGDAVVAFWGAPIARPDDADRAVRAAVAMYEAGEAFRREAPEGVPPLGVTRVGLHQGEAIVGNFGGEGRIQYTALGDAMNCASRLESANKQVKSTVLVSRSARERSTLSFFRPLGRIAVSGRSTPIEIFEPVPHLPPEDVTLLTDAYARFDTGDATALEALERYAAEHPQDAAIANLVYRLKSAGPGGTFVLESK